MKILGPLEGILFTRRKSKMKRKFNPQALLTLATFLVWIPPGLGEEKPAISCRLQELGLCSSACSFVWNKCAGSRDCGFQLCSHFHPICHSQFNCPQFINRCWNFFSECPEILFQNGNKIDKKRSILNKNVAYLLLKLHPFLNQTSQYGFLTSARFRRIGGNFGTEFLGKRSNKNDKIKVKPSPPPRFYSLPLDRLSKVKILKRNFLQELETLRDKRKMIGGNGRVILGSEFLGKRATDGEKNSEEAGRTKRLVGNEFLGKRNREEYLNGIENGDDIVDYFNGNELLGKRNTENSLGGTELLGKKNTRNNFNELLGKRYLGNEFLGKKRTGNELLGKKRHPNGDVDKMWAYYDTEVIDEAFPNFRSFDYFKPDVKALEYLKPAVRTFDYFLQACSFNSCEDDQKIKAENSLTTDGDQIHVGD